MTDSSHAPSLEAFERTTSRWGAITLALGFVISMALPLYLVIATDIDLQFSHVIKAYLAVAAVFGVFWIVEPVSYYPILGPAGMYQAFLIGNIVNKLVPSAMVAQETLGVQPGTPKGNYTATLAICGAAFIHVFTMVLLVGWLGTWIVNTVPETIVTTVKIYVFPAILGPIIMQLILTNKRNAVIIAAVVSAVVVFVLVPLVPALAPVQVAVAVLLSVVGCWLARNKMNPPASGSTTADTGTIN